jgi:hypothetical protein
MDILNRKAAIAAGLSKYFTGKPCKNGHISPRYTASGTCETCINGENHRNPPDPARFRDAKNGKVHILEDKIQEHELEIKKHELKISALRREIERVLSMPEPVAKERKLDGLVQTAKLREGAREMLASFQFVREPIAPLDLSTARALVQAYAIQRHAGITMGDLWPAVKPAFGEVYTFRVHAEDVAPLRAQLQAMFRERRIAPLRPVQEIRERITAGIVADEEIEKGSEDPHNKDTPEWFMP